jgi:peroxiredoxin
MKILVLAVFSAAAVFGQSLNGMWDATVVSRGVTVPFRMQFASQGTQAQGWFFNADTRTPSTSGHFENGKLVLSFAQLGTRLEAQWKGDHLEGTYYGTRVTGTLPFQARPAGDKTSETPASGIPLIAGQWEIAGVKSGKHEQAWRFIVQQAGATATATILRVDGDTGALTGSWEGHEFVLSHFSGARAALMRIQPQPDGSLAITLNGNTHYRAVLPKEARAEDLPAPADPESHTGVKDPSEPFRFSFHDLNGNLVSQSDARFQNKVVLIGILGSWCPNCHDEAPFLVELYRRFHAQGLEVVGLAFEEEDQLANPVRLRAFVKQYGIEYPMLLCGVPDEASAQMPQLRGFDAWPTVLLLGRDGRVRRVHSGFPSKGSGPVYIQTRQELTATVETLLAEPVHSDR